MLFITAVKQTMCDTLIVLPALVEDGKCTFAKNSHREPNEAQTVVRYPAQKHPPSMLPCTYLAIPQVKETFGVILAKPFWTWGAEMGANECGVIIGNALVFTKVTIEKGTKSLTGLDLVRLGLERSKTAIQAIQVITELLAEYGSDGCVGYENKMLYAHHSFIIADPFEAWVLETAGREWAAEKVKDCRTISNGLTIGTGYDLISPGAIELARKHGWLKPGEPLNFSEVFSLKEMDEITACHARREVTQLGINRRSRFHLRDAFSILSNHQDSIDFRPEQSTAKDVCMHATRSNPTQTVNSMVIQVDSSMKPEVWVTCTSTPCLSFFKPISFGTTDLDFLGTASAYFDSSFWWTVERFHRLANHNYKLALEYVEEEMRPHFEKAMDATQRFDEQASIHLFEFHRQAAITGFEKLRKRIRTSFFSMSGLYWRSLNKKANLSFSK